MSLPSILKAWKNWLLPASLVANAFLLGVLIGPQLHRWPPSPHGLGGPWSMVEEMAQSLSPEDARILQDAFANRKEPYLENDRALKSQFDRMRGAIAAEPFDKDRLNLVFAGMRAAHQGMDDAIAQALLDALPRMSAAGRRQVADWRPPGPPGGPPPGPPPH